jgi:CRP/FNR family transcriptional regulator, cyclic AMP receptor protein
MRLVAPRPITSMVQLENPDAQRDISGLVTACRRNRGYDSRTLTPATWRVLAEALVPEVNDDRASVIREGDNDRSLYFLESGLLRVYCSDNGSRLQLAVIVPGSVVGEGGFFAPKLARSASVEAIEPSRVWKLAHDRFEAMTLSHPAEALALVMYVGGVMRGRMLSVAGRFSVI